MPGGSENVRRHREGDAHLRRGPGRDTDELSANGSACWLLTHEAWHKRTCPFLPASRPDFRISYECGQEFAPALRLQVGPLQAGTLSGGWCDERWSCRASVRQL